jgi:sentrin-specific protease 1
VGNPVDVEAAQEVAQASAWKSLRQDFGGGAARLMERVSRAMGKGPVRDAAQQERERQAAELLEVQAQLERSRLQGRERLRRLVEPPREGSQAPPEEADPATRPLDAEEAALYEAALESGGDPGEVLASNSGANLHITRGDLACMRAPQWLNDEAVNFYMATLNDRDARDRAGPKRLPRCHFFNTFFFAKLESAGYKGVKRWSLPKKLVYKGKDIHAGCDRVIFPIHRPGHWTCAMVDVAGKRIVYLDSMSNGSEDPEVPEALAEWYKLDRAEKKQEDLPIEDWPIEYWDCPQQRNGYDCGVFAAKFCDYLGRAAELSFGQEHMALFRERIVADICRNRAD